MTANHKTKSVMKKLSASALNQQKTLCDPYSNFLRYPVTVDSRKRGHEKENVTQTAVYTYGPDWY